MRVSTALGFFKTAFLLGGCFSESVVKRILLFYGLLLFAISDDVLFVELRFI